MRSFEDGEEYGTACVVCDKVFKTEKAYQNHQKSKKHKQAVDELKRHMKEEDALFLDSEINDPEDDDNTPVANGNGNRQGKKKKRRNRREKSPDANDDDAVENPVSSTPDELADGVAEIRIDDDANSEEVQPPVETTPVESVPAKAQKSKKKTKGTPAPPPPKKGPTVPIESICKVCGLDFDSRSKLFKHIEATGHAALKTDVPANAPKSGKKKGRK